MKKTAIVTIVAMMGGIAGAAVVVSDDFNSYTPGAVIGTPNFGPKWDGSDTTQQNLFTADAGGYGVLDTTVAKRNYHISGKIPFTMGAGVTATVGSDFRYSHEAGGDIAANFNKNAFGLQVGTTADWWNGTKKSISMANRGSAMGNTLPVDPWVEGWETHSSLGVNTTAGGLSDWLRIDWRLFDNGTTILGQATISNITAATLLYTTTEVDLGLASGSTLYAGYTTDWNGVGSTNIASFSKIDAVHMDNFIVSTNAPALGGPFPLTDPGNAAGWIPYDPMTDEFDGTALDPQKWEPLGWDGRMPVYHEYNNVALSNGIAVLGTGWFTNGPQPSVSESRYDIAAGYFQSTTMRRYGYFEIRCRALDFPIMTTWWLTGGSSSYTREIDMLECPSGVAGKKDYYSCNFHIWKTPTPTGVVDNNPSIPDPENYTLPFDMVGGFHTYGFEWDKDFCKIYIDGQLYRTRATGSFKVGQRLMVGNEYNGWLNTIAEINSNLGKLGASYDVDYVRAWIKPETDTTWYVDATNGNDSNSGLGWGAAKKSIPAAIDAAYDGDSIWVAGGTYPEYLTFYGMHNLKVYGGFVPGDTLLGDRDPQANPTTIESPQDGYSPVNVKGNVGFRLDGFTVLGTTKSYEHGIDIEGSCSNVVVANCRIVGHNPADGGGSGAYVDGVDGQGMAYVRFENCEFSENKSYGLYAGGAAFGARDGAVVDIVDSQIIDNDTSGDGGFMSMQWGQENTIVRMTNCLIAANTNSANRGIIRQNYGTIELVDCTIMNNTADGVESDQWGSPSTTIENTLFIGNGGEGFWANHGNFSLQGNLFFDNPGGHVNYGGDKNTEPAINGLLQASGNIVADPAAALPVAQDSDNDQMPDWWEIGNGLVVAIDDSGTDHDNDGSPAGTEFVAGTDPHDSGSALAAMGVPDAGGFKLSVDSKAGRLYAVEMSDDLMAGWSDLTNGIAGTGSPIDIVDGYGTSNRFYRIRVELQ